MTCPNSTPPTVLEAKAISPRAMILRVFGVRNVFASIVAPTVIPRKIVTVLRISFWAAWFRRSVQPHSRRRFPNIRSPTRGTAAGKSKPQDTVAMIGNRTRSVRLTGRSWAILMPRSFFVVHMRIMGGWISGTRDM